MKNQKITPIGKKILILEKKPEQFFPGTKIIIPDNVREKTYQGHVVGIGKEISDINVGDLVQYVDYANAQEMQPILQFRFQFWECFHHSILNQAVMCQCKAERLDREKSGVH